MRKNSPAVTTSSPCSRLYVYVWNPSPFPPLPIGGKGKHHFQLTLVRPQTPSRSLLSHNLFGVLPRNSAYNAAWSAAVRVEKRGGEFRKFFGGRNLEDLELRRIFLMICQHVWLNQIFAWKWPICENFCLEKEIQVFKLPFWSFQFCRYFLPYAFNSFIRRDAFSHHVCYKPTPKIYYCLIM